MGSHCSFGHLKHKLWPNEGSGVKLTVWLLTRRSQELTRFTWLQRACNISLERSWQELQLCFTPQLDSRSVRKVMGFQSCRSPNRHNFATPMVASLKSGLWCESNGPCCPWFVLAPKVLQLCTYHFVWVVCKPVWVSETCQLLVPSRNFNMPLYPSKCCELRSVPWLLPLSLSFTWTLIWVLQGVGSASRGENTL
jgi:hypothetical protein